MRTVINSFTIKLKQGREFMKMKKGKHFNRLFAAIGIAVLLFLPQTAFSGVPTPGTVITAGNVDQYTETMAPWIVRMVKDGYGFLPPVTITVKESEPNGPPETFMAATRANVGKVSLDADGQLVGWTSGLPFPEPSEPDMALKCMWNQYHRWVGDDYTYDPTEGLVSCGQRRGGEVGWGGLNWTRLKFEGRTDIEPIPSMKNRQNLYFAFHMKTVGTGSPTEQLIYRYVDPKKADDMWTYVPSLRRTLKMVSSERSNPIGGGVKTWDDLFGFDGRVNDFHYEMEREGQMLGLFNMKKRLNDPEVGDHVSHPVFTKDPWEVKPMYVVKLIPNDPTYPNSHRFLWLPKEHYFVSYMEIFDRKGEFWKGNYNAFTRVKTIDGQYGNFMNASTQVDVKTSYWLCSLFDTIKINSGVPMQRMLRSTMGQQFDF